MQRSTDFESSIARRARATLSALLLLAALMFALGTVPWATADEVGDNGRNPYTRDAITYVFNGEANNLNAFDTWTWEKTRVITNATDRPHVAGDLTNGLDINAQICFDPFREDGYFFIAGEDTGQSKTSVGGGQGWGYFELHVDPDSLDITGATQRGKVEPRYFETDSDNPENYGCGFLSNGNLVTGDVGDQFPQDPASGELILWFRPEGPDAFATGLTDAGTFPAMPYCKIDTNIPTAGQIYIGDDDSIYVGAQRPDTAGGNIIERPGGVYRFSPPEGGWPTSADECTGRHETADFTGDDADPKVEGYGFEVFIANGPGGLTPTGIVPVPDGLPNAGNFYMSSVFDGKISEFDASGQFVRFIMTPMPYEIPPYRTTGTPLGIGVDPADGTIYFADISVVAQTGAEGVLDGDPGALANINPGAGPGPNGMLRAIRFDDANNPSESIPVNGGLAFPDGIGIITLERSVVAAGVSDAGTQSPNVAPAADAAPSAAPAGTLPATGAGSTLVPIVLAAAAGMVGRGNFRRRRR